MKDRAHALLCFCLNANHAGHLEYADLSLSTCLDSSRLECLQETFPDSDPSLSDLPLLSS